MSLPRFHTLIAEHAKAQATAINSFMALTTMDGLELAPARDVDFKRIHLRNCKIYGNSGTLPDCIRVSFAFKCQPQVIRTLAVERGDSTNDMVHMLPWYSGSTNDFTRLICENRERAKLERLTISFNTVTNAGVLTAFTDYTNAVLEFVIE